MENSEFDWGYRLIDENLVKGASDRDFTPVVEMAGGEETCYLEFKATPWYDSPAAKAHGGKTCCGRDDYLWNVVKAIVALANTSGGAILLGINPKDKESYGRSSVRLPVVIKELEGEGWMNDWDRKSNTLLDGLSLDEYDVQDCGMVKLDGKELKKLFEIKHVSYRDERTAVLMVHQAEHKIIVNVNGADTMYVRDLGDVGRTKKITSIGEALNYHSPSREIGRRSVFRQSIARQPEMLGFVGHSKELDQLVEWLMPEGNRRSPTGLLCPICVCGDEGVGRSLLLAKAEDAINGKDRVKFDAVFRYDASDSKDLDVNDVLARIANTCPLLCTIDRVGGATLSRSVLSQIRKKWLRTLIVITNAPSPALFHDRELRDEMLSDQRITVAVTARTSFAGAIETDNPNRWMVLKINEWTVKNAKDLLLARSGKKAVSEDEKAALDQLVQIFRAIPAELCRLCETIRQSSSATPYGDALNATISSGAGVAGGESVWQGKIAQLKDKPTWPNVLPILSVLAVMQTGVGKTWMRNLFTGRDSVLPMAESNFVMAMHDISDVSSVVLSGNDPDISEVISLHPFFRKVLFDRGDQGSEVLVAIDKARTFVFEKVAETFAIGAVRERRWAGRVLTGLICRVFERQVVWDDKTEGFQLAAIDQCWRDERDDESRYCVKIMDWLFCNPLGRFFVLSLPTLGVGLSLVRDLLKKALYISEQMEKACVAKTAEFARRRMCRLYLGHELAALDRLEGEDHELMPIDELIASLDQLKRETVGLTPSDCLHMEILKSKVRLVAASDASDYNRVRTSLRQAVRCFRRIPHWRVLIAEADWQAFVNQLLRFFGKRTESPLEDVCFIFACLERAEREMEFGHARVAGAFYKRARRTAAKRDWAPLAAICLNREAYSYLWRKKYAKAIRKYQKVIELYSRTKGSEVDGYAGVGIDSDGRIDCHALEARYFIAAASWLRDVSGRGSGDSARTKTFICSLCGSGGLHEEGVCQGELVRSAELRGLSGTGDKFAAWRDNLRMRAGLVRLLGVYHKAGAVSKQNACYWESMDLNMSVLKRQEELFGAESQGMESADINDDIGNCCALMEDYQRAEGFVGRAYEVRSAEVAGAGRPTRTQRRKLKNSYERLSRIHAAAAVASFEAARDAVDGLRKAGDCVESEKVRTDAAFLKIKKTIDHLDADLRINANWAVGLLKVEQQEENERMRQMFRRLQREELRPVMYKIFKGDAGNSVKMSLIIDGNEATEVSKGV